MLMNRDGPAIEPGARSYRRSWIRDGAMIGDALLRMGQPEAVREFLEWFAPYQYADGKVPCCVDTRGADPVAEHDSHGELIYAIARYYRTTGDRAFLDRMWPHVAAAVGYMDSLRLTDSAGIMPPSISHEGYSAKPVHSYWDDFFALRGLTDAADLAAVLQRGDLMQNKESEVGGGNPGQAFANALCKAVATMAGITLNWKEEPFQTEMADNGDRIAGVMVLSGNLKSVLILSAAPRAAREIVSYMTGMETSELSDEDLTDSMVELVNMTAGGARARLADSDYAFHLTSPFAITGKGIKLVAKRNTIGYSAKFYLDQIQLSLKVFKI
jgi:CheY-specific phosphatase CheX